MIEKVIKIAEDAGEILMKYFEGELNIQTKTDKFDLVTQADIETDIFIRTELKRLFPGDLILSEESHDIPKDFTGNVWMVDPLDGTKGYVNGNKSFAVMIGLCKNGESILGVVYIPAKGKLYFAEKNKGAFLREKEETRKVSVSDIYSLEESRLITYNRCGEERDSDEMLDAIPVREQIPESSAGVKLCLVAEGKAEIHIHTNSRGSKWDTCAPQIILEEAGGKLTHHTGKDLNYLQDDLAWKDGFIGTNSFVHEKIVKFLVDYNS